MDAKNSLQIYSFEKNEIRIVMRNNEPWFILKDVIDVLNLKTTSHIAETLDDDDKFKIKTSEILPTSGVGRKFDLRAHHHWLISESGLYFCVLRSDKPNAVKFQKWITKEVLPKLRKTGSYSIKPKKEKTNRTELQKLDRKLCINGLELITLLDEIYDKRKELKKVILEKLEIDIKNQ